RVAIDSNRAPTIGEVAAGAARRDAIDCSCIATSAAGRSSVIGAWLTAVPARRVAVVGGGIAAVSAVAAVRITVSAAAIATVAADGLATDDAVPTDRVSAIATEAGLGQVEPVVARVDRAGVALVGDPDINRDSAVCAVAADRLTTICGVTVDDCA